MNEFGDIPAVQHIPGTDPDLDAIYCRILPNSKTPVGADWVAKAWGERPATFNQIKADLENARCGFGLVFRYVGAHGVVAFDIDNAEGRELFIAIAGYPPEEAPTLSWSSGKQFDGSWSPDFTPITCITVCYYLSQEQAEAWDKRKVLKGNVLDARMGKNQSVLPSKTLHPTTGQPYRYVNYRAIAPLPEAIREGYDRAYSEQNPKHNHTARGQQQNCQCSSRHSNSDNDLSKLISDVYSRLTVDQIYTWGKHSWKGERGGKLVGYCPRHESKSGTAFQVNTSTGEWYCHGCGTGGHAIEYRWFVEGGNGTPTGRNFWQILKELADTAGVELPFRDRPEEEWGEPDQKAYAEYLTWEQQQEALEQYLHECDCQQWIVNLFTKLQKKAAKLGRRLRQWGLGANNLPPVQLNNHHYQPGRMFPPEIYQLLNCPKIIFQQGDRATLIRELKEFGYKFSLDTSHPGQGKTEDVVSWEVSYFDAHRLWLFTENPRLPQTATQETNYRPMPVRHNGMVRDDNLLTPLGNPVIRWPRQGESTNVTPNCYRAELFHTVAEKGYSLDGDQGDLRNPICRTCRFQGVCHKQQGTGFGFRRARKGIFGGFDSAGEVMPGERRVSLNPLSSPNPENYDYSRDIGFWDESSRILRVTKSLTARLSDIDRVFGELEEKNPQLHQLLTDFRLALRRSLNDDKQPYYGWDLVAVRERLPIPDNIAAILTQLQELQPDWDELFAEDSVGMDGVDMTGKKVAEYKRTKRLLADVRRLLRRQPFEAAAELPVNWLIPTLQILAGWSSGSLRIHRGALSITLRDNRQADVAKAMRFNLFLDATGNKNELAIALGINSHEIVQIEQEPPNYSNLTIVQVNGFGVAGNNRSDSCDARIAAAKVKLRELHDWIAFFDHLSKKEKAGGCDAHHFGNQTRGSNVFTLMKAIASFGLPAPSMSAVQDYYQAVTGQCVKIDSDEFSQHYNSKVQAEIIQEIGRLRAQRRPGEQLTYYLCADINAEFLKQAFPGCRVISMSAFQLCPEAAAPGQQTRWAILQAFRAMQEAGEKIVTTTLAAASGISQGRLSQIAGEFGGWGQLKKLLALLNKQLYRATNNSGEVPEVSLDEELQWLAQTYLPLAVEDWQAAPNTVGDVVTIIQSVGWRTFEQVVRQMPVSALAKLIGLLGAVLSDWEMEINLEHSAPG